MIVFSFMAFLPSQVLVAKLFSKPFHRGNFMRATRFGQQQKRNRRSSRHVGCLIES
jgi:hypothetical protein